MRKIVYLFIFIFLIFISSSLIAKPFWKITYPNGNEVALRIQCVDSTDCIACYSQGNFCLLNESTNGGNSWNVLYDESDFVPPNYPHPYYIENMQYTDKRHLYILYGDMGAIKRSSNRGKTWDTTYITEAQNLCHMKMLDSTNGIAASPTKLFITSDGWKSYKLIPTIHAVIGALWMHSLTEIDVVRNLGIFGKTDSTDRFRVIYSRTSDAGLTWIQDSICNFHTKSLFFINRNIGWLAASKPLYIGDQEYDMLMKTSDGGISWKLVYNEFNDPSAGLQDVAFYDTLNGIAVGQWGKILRTSDGGETWFREYLPNDPPESNKRIQPPSMNVTFVGNIPIIGTFNGGIYKLMDDGEGAVDDVSENSLLITPNPASDFITITMGAINPKVNLGVDESPEILIYNTLGECVLSEPILPMKVSQRMNIESLPKGIYFVKVGGETAKFVKM